MKKQQASDDIIIRIPRKLYNRRMQNILLHIEHLKVVSGSKATEESVAQELAVFKSERGKLMKSYLKSRGLISK